MATSWFAPLALACVGLLAGRWTQPTLAGPGGPSEHAQVLHALDELRADVAVAPARRRRSLRTTTPCPAFVEEAWWRQPCFWCGALVGWIAARLWAFLASLERVVASFFDRTRPREVHIAGEPLRLRA